MRWTIAGAAAVGVLSLGLLYTWMAATQAGAAADWRTRDLLFLKSALDRVHADLERQAGGTGEASLRRERQALLQAMAATARKMPAEAIPDKVKVLLPDGAAPPAEAPMAAVAAVASPVELRAGLTASRLSLPNIADLTMSPDPYLPPERRPRGGKRRTEPPAPKPADTVARTPARPPEGIRAASVGAADRASSH